MFKKLIVTNVKCHKCHILSQPKSVRSQLLQCKTNCSFVCLFAPMFILIVIGARMFITEESEKKRKNGNYQLNQSDFCVRFLINLFCIVLT